MRAVLLSLLLSSLVSSFVIASDEVPTQHKSHCRVWQDGACVAGALTDLALSLSGEDDTSTKKADACEKVCKEGCPRCNECDLCSFCSFYNDDACIGVKYYDDPETCTEASTQSCCEVCDTQCSDQGACGSRGYCNGGDRRTNTLVKCIEQTTGERCKPCRG